MKTRRAGTVAALLACTLALSACEQAGHVAGSIGALTSLSEDIREHFSESLVAAKLVNDQELIVEIANSDKRKLPDQERSQAAVEVARYAYSRYEARDRLAKVVVSFGRRWSILAFSYGSSDEAGVFEFKGDDLATWYRAQST
jgi:hypothetical protein